MRARGNCWNGRPRGAAGAPPIAIRSPSGSAAPLGDRIAIGGAPAAPRGRPFQQLPRARMDALEVRHHLFLAAVAHAPFFLVAAVEGDDEVVLLAVAQGVMNQVAIRAG